MSTKPKIPSLRFPEFSGEWEEKRLGDYLVEHRERVGSSSDLPVYSSSREGLKAQKDYFDNRELLNNGEYGVVPYGYFTYRHMSDDNIFKFNINNYAEKIAVSKEYPVFTTLDLNSIFLKYKLNFGKDFERFATMQKLGGTRTRLYFKNLCNWKTLLPKLNEQQKIADFLTAVDARIEALSRQQKLIEQYKKGMMQKIFSQEMRFRADDGSEFPEWEEEELGKYLVHKSHKNKDYTVDLVLSVSNKKGFISQDEQFGGYAVASKDLSSYKIVKNGDYAYNPSRINVGSIARLKNFQIGIVSPMYVTFALTENLKPEFFDNLLQTHYFKHMIKVRCSGSVRDSLNFEDMANFYVLIPSIAEQTKIADFLSSIDSKIEVISSELQAAKKFKKALLQQMFV